MTFDGGGEGRADKWKYSNEDWYGRMGYVVTGLIEQMWTHSDPTGKVWWFAAVSMKKDIR